MRYSVKSKALVWSLIILLALAIAAVFMLLWALGFLPSKYFMAALATVAALYVITITLLLRRGKKENTAGAVIGILLLALMIIALYYLAHTQAFISAVSGDDGTYTTDYIAVSVPINDPANTLAEAAGYTFGILEVLSRDAVDEAVERIEAEHGPIKTTEYTTLDSLISAMSSGEVDGLIYNRAYDESMDELLPGFVSTLKALEVFIITSEREEGGGFFGRPGGADDSESNLSGQLEPFVIYLTGIDTYGPISTRSRSDVNLLACVNPQTKQILLISTPRDSYVYFPNVTGSSKDKLTHAGLYGVQVSMDTLSELYDVDINGYVRINFTSLINIVDILGGITVYSEQSFTANPSRYAGEGYDFSYKAYSFTQGYNELDGAAALVFCRERYAFTDGDFQRGKNQLAVLSALIEKAMSPAILTGYTSILDSLKDNFETNLTSNDIASVVSMVLEDTSGWEISSIAAEGATGSNYCYSTGGNASVVYLDEDCVADIKQSIEQLLGAK